VAEVKVADADAAEKLAKEFADYVENNPVSGKADVAGSSVTLHLDGKAAHGASPQLGTNAGTFLAVFLNNYDFDKGAKAFIENSAKYIHEDVYGKKLGVDFNNEKMGELTMNAGIFSFKDGQENDNRITLNFRYPKGTTNDEIKAKLEELFGSDVKVTEGAHHMLPHYVPADDPLVATLLDTFEEHTGIKGEEKVIGGGTFGRLLERGVAYGAQFPGFEDTMHQANEYMSVEDILNSAVIYADAIYRLVK
jgi:predicted dipeptidase